MITRRAFHRLQLHALGVVGAIATGVASRAARAEVQTTTTTMTTMTTTAKALLLLQRDAWNRGDLDAFCASYADDCVFVSPSGLTRGRDAVLTRYRSRYGTAPASMGTLGFEFVDERHTADSATFAMRWSLTWPDKQPAAGLTLVVWQRTNDTWRLVQDASM